MTFKVYFLGCRTNQAEIEEISQKLLCQGFALAKEKQTPDLILLNTCAVTQKAEKETRKEIRKLKKTYPRSFLMIMGCAVDACEQTKTKLPNAESFIKNKDKATILKLIEDNFPSEHKINKNITQNNKYASSGRSLVKIQDGCKNFCTYCIVPFLRTEFRSKNSDMVIEEINKLVQNGIKEVILTGINISTYGTDLKPKLNINQLIKKILTQTKVERISLSSLNPNTLNPELAQLIINNPRLSNWLHLSLQSGSASVLERMKRKTKLRRFINLLHSIKQQIPDFVFRADIITGFPQETEEEFQQTLDIIKNAAISFIHPFPYSPRPGTLAFYKLQKGEWQDLPFQIKKERVDRILQVSSAIRKKESQNLLGKTLKCLILKELPNHRWETLAYNSWKVIATVPKGDLVQGQIKQVQISQAKDDHLIGVFTNS